MSGDLLALILGAVSLGLYLAIRIRRKAEKERQRRKLRERWENGEGSS